MGPTQAHPPLSDSPPGFYLPLPIFQMSQDKGSRGGGNQEGELSLVQRPSLNLTPEFRAHCVAVTDSSTCDTESCYTYNFEVAAKEPRLRE